MAINFSDDFEMARQAMASLELFAGHYASSTKFQEHKNEVIEILAQRAANRKIGDPSDNFLSHFCAALRKV